MVAEWLQRLLLLQDRDFRYEGIKRQLEDIPIVIEREEANIRKVEEDLAIRDSELKSLEVRRLELEGEVEDTEARILKYKTQQMQVKKNEEYTALEHEISVLKVKISEIEDTELLLLEQIDTKQSEYRAAVEEGREQKALFESHIARLRENHASFAAELDEAKAAVQACEADIDSSVLQQYTYVKSQVKRPPVVVPLENGRCQGCHLRVSGEVESETRRATDLVRCDSCGRILYFDR